MKTNHTFAVSAIVRKSKANKAGEIPVYIRIILNSKATEIATKFYIRPDLWDNKTGRTTGKDPLQRTINDTVDFLKLKAKQEYYKLLEAQKEIDLQLIKNAILGIEEKQPTLLDIFTKMVNDVKAKVGIEVGKSCYCGYSASLAHITTFIKDQYQKDDINLKALNYRFIADYELYLKTKGKCRQNGALKHIHRLKAAIKLAIKYEYLDKDPFLQHAMSKERVIKQPLNEEELERIERKIFFSDRLNIIKDMFLFTCYTGLAFIDAKTLKKEHIGIGVDGEEWIFTERRKTGNPCAIPLLPPAQVILEKYKNHPKVMESGYLLPIPSNQKFNDYLKEIADLCGIRKPLHVHIGRHTFATTIALQNGVPMEVLKEMLGHDKIETTEIYGKVKVHAIAKAMKELRAKLKPVV